MMSMADYFSPDINSVSMRSVYPTADGGTTSGAAAGLNGFTNVLVTSPTTGESGVATTTTSDVVNAQDAGKGLWSWVGILALLLVVVFIARKAGGPEDFRNIRPTFYNFMAVTLTAIVGIWGLKVLAARFRVPGVSAVILSV